jgi:3-mercaptopyruvate sulfurtransferase SseA
LLARVAGIAGIDYLDGHMNHWRRAKRPLQSISSRLPVDQ